MTAYELRISDWSSDVCSSDLDDFRDLANITPVIRKSIFDSKKVEDHHGIIPTDECVDIRRLGSEAENLFDIIARRRSEERRVGKESLSSCNSRWSPHH